MWHYHALASGANQSLQEMESKFSVIKYLLECSECTCHDVSFTWTPRSKHIVILEDTLDYIGKTLNTLIENLHLHGLKSDVLD